MPLVQCAAFSMATESNTDLACVCCGHRELQQVDVLWKELTDTWQLSQHEIAYVNRQQGMHCPQCKTNLRAMALAKAFMSVRGFEGTFQGFLGAPAQQELKILEINGAGNLHQFLKSHPGHTLGEYPEVDITALPYADSSFDIVVHSDTLEHVEHPVRGLEECRRVLKRGGACIFTVPIIVDRMTISCAGRPPSYHGNTSMKNDDFLVRTEYGCDAWKDLVRAGFSDCRMFWLDYPAASALCGIK